MIPTTDVKDAPAPGYFASPSILLANGANRPAYELKFLLAEDQAKEILERVDGRLMPDPHVNPLLGDGYGITSLYFDTAQFEVYLRLGPYKYRKHRLRRYDQAPCIFLERKSRKGDRVKKRRTMIPDLELALLRNGHSQINWPGHWFHRHLVRRRLLPVCRIAYHRVALIGESATGPVRLTLDRRVRGQLTGEWNVNPLEEGLPVLDDQVICEFKYRVLMPALFKDILQAMQLTPRPVSKYRAFLQASGLLLPAPAANGE